MRRSVLGFLGLRKKFQISENDRREAIAEALKPCEICESELRGHYSHRLLTIVFEDYNKKTNAIKQLIERGDWGGIRELDEWNSNRDVVYHWVVRCPQDGVYIVAHLSRLELWDSDEVLWLRRIEGKLRESLIHEIGDHWKPLG